MTLSFSWVHCLGYLFLGNGKHGAFPRFCKVSLSDKIPSRRRVNDHLYTQEKGKYRGRYILEICFNIFLLLLLQYLFSIAFLGQVKLKGVNNSILSFPQGWKQELCSRLGILGVNLFG